MPVVVETLSWACLVAGSFFALTGGIGVVRLPDVFSRLHATGVTDTMGAGLILIGLMFQAGWTFLTLKLLLLLGFLLVTTPTSTHALAQAALHGNLKPLLERRRQ